MPVAYKILDRNVRHLLLLVALAIVGCSCPIPSQKKDSEASQNILIAAETDYPTSLIAFQDLVGSIQGEDPQKYITAANDSHLPMYKRAMARAAFFKRYVPSPFSLRALISEYPDIERWFLGNEIIDVTDSEHTPLGPDVVSFSVYAFIAPDSKAGTTVVTYLALSRRIEKHDLQVAISKGELPADLLIISVGIN